MNEQSRINAMIAYFFLGPLFLMARKGTPLSEPFVRRHALHATEIIGIGLVVYVIYISLLRSWLDFSIWLFHIHDIILTLISGVLMISLVHGAYRAFQGEDHTSHRLWSTPLPTILIHDSPSEIISTDDEKVRIIAGMIPFLGIYLAAVTPTEHMIRARVIGSLLGCLIIGAACISSAGSFLFTLSIIISVIIYVGLAVYIFLEGRSLIPKDTLMRLQYEVLESHLFASIESIREFFRIAFGGTGRRSYGDIFQDELEKQNRSFLPGNPYFMPASLIGIPYWNLLTLPSLWISSYKEYRPYIIAGAIITFSITLIAYTFGSTHPVLAFFLFPITHMVVYASRDHVRYIPGVHIIMRLIQSIEMTHTQVRTGQAQNTDIHFTYDEEKK